MTRSRHRREHRWVNRPELLIYGVRSVGDVWHKLVWDITNFEELITTRPVDLVSIPFSYTNVCVSAVALRDWFNSEAHTRAKLAGERWSDRDSEAIVRAKVRWSHLAEDVANTFKHRGYRSTAFEDVHADLRITFPARLQRERDALKNDWDAALFALRHQEAAICNLVFRDDATGAEINSFELFSAWEHDWHALLSAMAMLDD